MKKLTYYFSHDGNARNDDKILALRAKHGAAGYGRYFLLVEMLFEAAQNKLPLTKWFPVTLAREWDCTADEAQEFLQELVNDYELISSDGEHIFSDSLFRRVQAIEGNSQKRRDAAKKAAEARWQGNTAEDDANAMRTHSKRIASAMQKQSEPMRSDANKNKTKQNKEEENKEDQKDEPAVPVNSNTLTRTETNKLFAEWWDSYPKKVARAEAKKSFEKLKITPELADKMIAAVKKQSQSDQWTKDGGQFIPNPSTWLNQDRWEDELPLGGRVGRGKHQNLGNFDQREYSEEFLESFDLDLSGEEIGVK